MLSLVLSIIPVQNVYAGGPSPHSSSSHSSPSMITNNSPGGHGTHGTGASESGGAGESEKHELIGSRDLNQDQKNDLSQSAHDLITSGDMSKITERLNALAKKAGDDAAAEDIANLSHGTTASGYRIYMGMSGDVSANMSSLQIRTAFEQAASARGTPIGIYHTNGSKYKFNSEPANISEAFNKLMALSESGTLDAYKQVWTAFGLDITTL